MFKINHLLQILIFLLFLSPSFSNASNLDDLPVSYRGRFRPFKVAAPLILQELGLEVWKEKKNNRIVSKNPQILLLALNAYGWRTLGK
jgi:hypothetical protein